MNTWKQTIHFFLVLQIWWLVSAGHLWDVHAQSKEKAISKTCHQKLSIETKSVSIRPKDLFYALQVCVTINGNFKIRPTLCNSTNNINQPGRIEFALSIKDPETGKSVRTYPIDVKYTGNSNECVVYHPCAIQGLLKEFSKIKDNVEIIAKTSIYGLQSVDKDTSFRNAIWGSGAIIEEETNSLKFPRRPFTGVCHTNSTKICSKMTSKQFHFLNDKERQFEVEGLASCLLGDEFSNGTFVTYYNPSYIFLDRVKTLPTMPPIKPTTIPATKPTIMPTTEPTTIPATEQRTMPSTEPTTMPPTEPTTMPTTEPTTIPATKPTTMPTTEPTTVPATKPRTTPSTEPTIMPTTEPTIMPTTEPTAMSPTEPTTMPTTEPTTMSTTEPITMPNIELRLMPPIKPTTIPATKSTMSKETSDVSSDEKEKSIHIPDGEIPDVGYKEEVETSNGVGLDAKLSLQHNIIVFGLASIIVATMYS